ncbi:MAG: bifunctional UDP-N-acetylglucosamine diphosphorylase/glucosamine-1-phosphate N-acetyltransferase GlmU [Acidobacteria bacterium]|nr:bifunctional UDP-N-acetylglucosamine diphosphorylase/glucosamine-1-phosphate N-acetyltransferase GlmU [Acidobacteriota bacterium]
MTVTLPEDVIARLGVIDADLGRAIVTVAEQRGTAHAVLAAEKLLRRETGTLLVLNGDVPLARPETLRALLAHHARTRASFTVLTTRLDAPAGYGRILRSRSGALDAICEQADIAGRREIEEVKEINAGLYCAEVSGLFGALRATSTRNAQKEYYLPDLVSVLRAQGRRVEAMLHPMAGEVLGINTRADLARAEKALFRRKAEELMIAGVTLIDPETTYVEASVRIAPDTTLHPNVTLSGTTTLGEGCVVHSGTRIADSAIGAGSTILDHCVIVDARVGRSARIGPFAHLRPGSELGEEVHVGNFVETKKARLRDRAKANHLAYLGDAEIGRDVNVGAGTITCNYDGWEKHRTVLGDGVFIGSDTQLVAPVRVGKGAFVGAGSTITRDVPDGALALSRVKQQTILGWAVRKREEMAARHGKISKAKRPKRR